MFDAVYLVPAVFNYYHSYVDCDINYFKQRYYEKSDGASGFCEKVMNPFAP